MSSLLVRGRLVMFSFPRHPREARMTSPGVCVPYQTISSRLSGGRCSLDYGEALALQGGSRGCGVWHPKERRCHRLWDIRAALGLAPWRMSL